MDNKTFKNLKPYVPPRRRNSLVIGYKVNYLTFQGWFYIDNQIKYVYLCDCGEYISLPVSASVSSGKKKSCGCRSRTDLDKMYYERFKEDQREQLLRAGILYLSFTAWKSDSIPYWCPTHKEYKSITKACLRKFKVAPCFKCGRIIAALGRVKSTEEFIIDSKRIWGDWTFDYSKTVYDGSHGSVTFICSRGNTFTQTATDHLSGCIGCPCCNNGAGGFSGKIKGYFYLMKWYSPEGETFLKYGITNRKNVYLRAKEQSSRTKNINFHPKLLIKVEFEDGEECKLFEKLISSTFGKSYISKSKFPDGYTETVSPDKEKYIMEFIKDNT